MHMADALISPAVGGTMWAAAAGLVAYSSRKLKEDLDERRIPLMGVLGAFIFAAQMINFTIPGTGSSGHIGGGMVLTILLGPSAAFLVIASVLTIQALLFADGGLLALGCNIFNLGFFPAFVGYPLIYRKVIGVRITRARILVGATLASVAGLQLGAFSVVLETLFSGISELRLGTFLLLMQPIHLGIGIVEGFVTAAVVLFIFRARPEILEIAFAPRPLRGISMRNVLAGITVVTILTAGLLSWFASTHPDGLEWSILRSGGERGITPPEKGVHRTLKMLQEKIALLPDYSFSSTGEADKKQDKWPAVDPGTSVSGIVGGTLTLVAVVLIGLLVRRRSRTP